METTLNSCPLYTTPALHAHNKNQQLSTKHPAHKPLLLLQCGDIHPNPGPMPNLIQKHPTTHKKRQTTYFLPNTIKFHPEYQHLAKTFKPLFQNTHHLHAQTLLSLPYLYNYILQHTNHPPPRIIYALVVTISPSTTICNTYLQQPSIPDWTSQLLEKMTTLSNPPERHIGTPHPYTQFRNIYSDIITPPTQYTKNYMITSTLTQIHSAFKIWKKHSHTYQGNS